MSADDGRRPAAVVLGIFERSPHGVIFIQRSEHLPTHAGQIGLPGGGVDPRDDGDLARTALREMEEEVGVAPHRVTIAGKLPIVKARANNYAVTPFVATVAPGDAMRVDENETVGVFTVPLAFVIDELREGVTSIGAFEVPTPVLDYEGKHIWGLTGYILSEFVRRWNDDESELRKRIEARLTPR
jgi:8-oxo-dGTP pyrophosphatase MutT (NUDIX family)